MAITTFPIDTVTLDGLNPDTNPSPRHIVHATLDGVSTKLNVKQIRGIRYITKSAAYNMTVEDDGKIFEVTAAAEFELLPVATAGDGYHFYVKANGGAVTLDPNGTQQIDGSATSLVIPNGVSVLVQCDGTAWHTVLRSGSGMVGPGTVVDNYVPRFDGTTGSLLQSSALSIADNGDASLVGVDGSGAGGPYFNLDRQSASPAVNDLLAFLRWMGRDSAANAQIYAQIYTQIIDHVNGTEDGVMVIETVVAGTVAGRLVIGAGVYTPGATGGDKGTNTINAAKFYEQGRAITGASDAIIEDQKTTGTSGGTLTSGAWQTRTLNVNNNSGIITLASDQFTPAVDGEVEWSAPAVNVGGHQTRLYNVTDAVVVAYGTSMAATGVVLSTTSIGYGRVTAGKTYRLEHRCNTTRASDGLGLAASFGNTEVYARVIFRKGTP